MNSRLSAYVKKKFMRLATDLVKNPEGLKYKLEKATEKLSTNTVSDAVGDYLEDLKALIRMSKNWASRRYTNVSKQTIVYTILAIIYFVTPTDFVPDFILGLGLVDDIAVISWVMGLIRNDVEEYKQWEEDKSQEQEVV